MYQPTDKDRSYELASRAHQTKDSIVTIGKIPFGGNFFTVIAGPCAIESYEQLNSIAMSVKESGASVLRGGAYKPRTSPYSFQGLGVEGLKILQQISRELGIATVTEVMDTADLEKVAEYADALQVGARNMQNFSLLKAIGELRIPVILKRGLSARAEELLHSAEYILAGGNSQVILCERGIRTFETQTRNTLDLNIIPFLKERSHLPVIVDPSHGTGVRTYVAPMAQAAAACGADGVIIEVHCNPLQAWSDGHQSMYPENFAALVKNLQKIANVLGKDMVGNFSHRQN